MFLKNEIEVIFPNAIKLIREIMKKYFTSNIMLPVGKNVENDVKHLVNNIEVHSLNDKPEELVPKDSFHKRVDSQFFYLLFHN